MIFYFDLFALFEHAVGGNKELVTLFQTDIDTVPEGFGEGSRFFSDNNGLGLL